MARRKKIYEGKAKILYEGPEPGTLVQYFKDEGAAGPTATEGENLAPEGKGVLNNRLSEFCMSGLNSIGVPTHFIRRINMREQLVREVEIVPLEVVVRNVAAGSLAKRLGIEEGQPLPRSIIEFYYKNDQLGDPMVSEEHITAFNWASPQEIDDMMHMAIRINDFMSGLFLGIGIKLVDFKIEFGRLYENDMMRIVLADEISPDSCRLWGIKTQDKLDKDRLIAAMAAGSGQTVVFCDTKRQCDRVERALLDLGVNAAAIHGDLAQTSREKALKRFEKGEINILVATDVAARGIDIDDVSLVVHYEPPIDVKNYLHRSGRTARAGRDGWAVTLAEYNQHTTCRIIPRGLRLDIQPPIEVFSNDARLADLRKFFPE